VKRDAAPKLCKDVGKLPLDARQGFVLSRVDGRTTVKEIVLLMPFPEAETLAILKALVDVGAIQIEGERRANPSQRMAIVDAELPPEASARIEEMERRVAVGDPFALLDIALDADKREVKRAYFQLSKEFHPDRYFGKKLGPWQRRLQDIFSALAAAFELLSDDEQRAQAAREAAQKRVKDA